HAGVAVLLENQRLHTKLNAFGIVSAFGDVRAFAPLVVYGSDSIAFDFHQIHFGDQPETVGRQGYGTGVNLRIGILTVDRRHRQLAARLVHTPVRVAPLDRIRGVGPLALYPFEIGQ